MPMTFLDYTLLLLTSILLYSKFISYHYTVSIMRRTKSLNRESIDKHEAIMRISSMEAVNVRSNLTEDKKINMKISFKENVFEMLKVQENFAREVIQNSDSIYEDKKSDPNIVCFKRSYRLSSLNQSLCYSYASV